MSRRNYKRRVSSSFAPRTESAGGVEYEELKKVRMGKGAYYASIARSNREAKGIPDRSLTREQIHLIEARKRKTKKRLDALEAKLELEKFG